MRFSTPFEEVVDDGITVSLARAPRSVRVGAAPRLEGLLEQIRKRVDAFSEGIQIAKDLVAD